MWVFEGTYTGEAREYLQSKKKKQNKIAALLFSVAIVVLFFIMAVFLGDGNVTYILIISCAGIAALLATYLVLYLDAKRAPKSKIEIINDGFKVCEGGLSYSFAFYKIEPIEYYDDFIALQGRVVLQKELLVEGDWDALKRFLKKVQDSLDTDEPIYQIDEPPTDFCKATVKDKRVYEKFVEGGSWATPVGKFQYLVTFLLESGKEIEYEVGLELYQAIEKGQAGTLVTMSGNFFSFGDGEEVE